MFADTTPASIWQLFKNHLSHIFAITINIAKILLEVITVRVIVIESGIMANVMIRKGLFTLI